MLKRRGRVLKTNLFRPLLMLGSPASGKTMLVKNILRAIGCRPDKVLIVSKEDEYEGLGFWSDRARKKDFQDKRIIVFEDIPALANKRFFRILNELLSTSRHLKIQVIATSQTEEGVDMRLLRRFGLLCIFNNILDYWKIRKLFRGRGVAKYLVDKAEELEPFRFVLLDMGTKRFWNGLANDDEKAVRLILRGMRTRLNDGGEDLGEVADEKVRTKTRTNNNDFRKTKKQEIAELFLSGLGIREIVKKLNLSAGYVRVALCELRAEGYDIPKLKAGRPRKRRAEAEIIVSS